MTPERTAERADWLPALVSRLLEEASSAESKALDARHNRQRTAAQRFGAAAQAYYHAARLAGWRPESA